MSSSRVGTPQYRTARCAFNTATFHPLLAYATSPVCMSMHMITAQYSLEKSLNRLFVVTVLVEMLSALFNGELQMLADGSRGNAEGSGNVFLLHAINP